MGDSGGSAHEHVETARDAGESAYDVVVDVVLTGFTVIVPLVVTLYILQAALGFLTRALAPVIVVLQRAGLIAGVKNGLVFPVLAELGIYTDVVQFMSELTALVLLAVVVVGVGSVARFQYGRHAIDVFDYVVAGIPGIGSIYTSFRRMGDAMMESDIENFRDVKLVEFPREGTYVIAFETNHAPEAVEEAAGEGKMKTLFVPFAPNPVTGGFLTYVPTGRIRDVDMTVEEGVRSIITSGIATGQDREFVPLADLDLEEPVERLKGLGHPERVPESYLPSDENPSGDATEAETDDEGGGNDA